MATRDAFYRSSNYFLHVGFILVICMTGATAVDQSRPTTPRKRWKTPITKEFCNKMYYLVPAAFIIFGLYDRGPSYLSVLAATFGSLISFVLVCMVFTEICGRYWGRRIQERTPDYFFDWSTEANKKLFWKEVRESSMCLFTVSLMASFPIHGKYFNLYPSGLIWTLEEAGLTVWDYAPGFFLGIAGADIWLYTKHRMLHHRFLYQIHKTHHQFHSPTAFAGFAIHPIEAVWTFFPIILWTPLYHYIPLVFSSIGGFMLFNCYLHCGYTFQLLEVLLPLGFFNSSAFHNVHHEKTWTHFGEVGSFWDMVMGTAAIYDDPLAGTGSDASDSGSAAWSFGACLSSRIRGIAKGYRWHYERSLGQHKIVKLHKNAF